MEGFGQCCIHSKDKEESAVLVGDEMQQQNSGSFRICDLNLSGSPDASEIPVGPSIDHFTSAHRIEMHAGVSPERNMSTRNDTEDACNNSQLLGHAKVVQVINLEDSHEEVNSLTPSKQKGYSGVDDHIYVSLEEILIGSPKGKSFVERCSRLTSNGAWMGPIRGSFQLFCRHMAPIGTFTCRPGNLSTWLLEKFYVLVSSTNLVLSTLLGLTCLVPIVGGLPPKRIGLEFQMSHKNVHQNRDNGVIRVM
ncbi:hypothetical protein HPP92_028055, partial [Vanilla planifolia]